MANNYGNFSAKTVTETVVNLAAGSWTPLPTTAQTGRQLLEVYNKGENKLYLSFDNTATIKQRDAIGNAELRAFPVQDNLILYGRTGNGGTRVIVREYR